MSDPHDSVERQTFAYFQELHLQHVSVVDDLLVRHLLWSPELVYPLVEASGVMRTIVQLNDGRECLVTTFSSTGETSATEWKQAA